jgi:hypothetical protein
MATLTTVADGGRGRCPHQVIFQAQNRGRQIAATKRALSFRYGFANAARLMAGHTGTECRGEEHEIVVLWSITGGKARPRRHRRRRHTRERAALFALR